ncbi:MAG TPA: PEP-CTERM sorting domain-containing protein [Candidatus Accumulibacter phosphatis]|nr:hypothetical protein [Accumulibacter sp.]HRL77895.1 PEP-CTERM sorting domain-containing protein [Candidatus Accumulibacter phosphatis]HRQ97026.1 PEP-CTERM sorting domain-containing protein [Candidatus Accumulibacter phosphatis]
MTPRKHLAAVLAATGIFSLSLATVPVHAATVDVLSFSSGGLNCSSFFCSASVPFGGGNLVAATPSGYQGIGFNSVMVHNYSSGNPAGPASFSVSNLPAHSSLNLSFLLAIIDSWDGSTAAGGSLPPDVFNITVDGVSIFAHTYDNFLASDQSAPTANQMSFGSNLGFNPGWNDSAYDFTGSNALLNIPHNANTLTVEFFASGAGWQGGAADGGDESFGLDWVLISINTANDVPEPGSLALLGIGLAGLVARGRREKR